MRRPVRYFDSADTPSPHVALLGESPFTSFITNAGGGQTRAGNLALNRWRNDPTLDDHGQWIYINDLTTGKVWSAAHQPICAPAAEYKVTFGQDNAVFERRDGDIETNMEVALLPDSLAEVRRITLINRSATARDIELTSYYEIVLNAHGADRAHPAFFNLFVQTEWLESSNAILAMRRPRGQGVLPIWSGHVVAVKGGKTNGVSYETDRAAFLGRGRSTRSARAMDNAGNLDGAVGAVLDPVFSIRTRLSIPPGGSTGVSFTTFLANDRESAVSLSRRYSDADKVAADLDAQRARGDADAGDETVSDADAALFQELAGHMLFPEIGEGDFGDQLPGTPSEFPVLLGIVRSGDGAQGAVQLLNLHEYWLRKGIETDLVLLVEGMPSECEKTESALTALMPAERLDVVALRADEVEMEVRTQLHAGARMKVECDNLDLAAYVKSLEASRPVVEASPAAQVTQVTPPPSQQGGIRGDDLQIFNGLGGFNSDNEYEIRLSDGELPPAPWINVIANPAAGFTVSETGAGTTWAASSSAFRLTPWQNDPVTDRSAECIYIKDEDTGEIWTPTPAPIREATPYTIQHGAGYSTFHHAHDGITTSLKMSMPVEDSVKVQLLTVRNTGTAARRLTVLSYVEWVLGGDREKSREFIRSRFDATSGVMLARNVSDADVPGAVAFSAISAPLSSYTTARSEFLGRNGSYSAPAGLRKPALSSDASNVADPCAALATRIELQPGETKRMTIQLGAAASAEDALRLAKKYNTSGAAEEAIQSATSAWRQRLGAITVQTPEPAFDLMINQWSLYQAVASRMWGRMGLYQSSGAYGFRDQLQDSMAFVYFDPALAREHILRAASRQFEEGDVQHWWHPHNGLGIRTRFSDDLVWLPYVVDHYLRVTEDVGVLNEDVPYLRMQLLEEGEDEVLAVPANSELRDSLFIHCVRALERACTTGEHGLPLMGSGDWNDGMNRVGIEGRGESVWLAWFLIDTLNKFAVHADYKGETDIALELRNRAEAYRDAVEKSAWDGSWYRRAYHDDGAPLGSAGNDECEIDSIAQSWSVISGAGDPERSRTAMRALNERLVHEEARLIMLLTPSFDRGKHDPGYIQGYLPGVRENGAQYTHAALWAVMATALSGDGNRAMHLFQMINPITHALTPKDVSTYKVEPYVVAADVYTAEGHLGRGGWTWYTGSASWLYRVGLESILGFTKVGDELYLNPCIPGAWKEFSLNYRYGESVYNVVVRNPSEVEKGVVSVTVDGVKVFAVPLVDDGGSREVVVTMGSVPLTDFQAKTTSSDIVQ